MRKWVFVAGVAVGYVLGSRAGRQRYEQIVSAARKVRDNPTVRSMAGVVQDRVGQVAGTCRDKFGTTTIGEKLTGRTEVRPSHRPDYWETAGATRTTPGRNGSSAF